ncbi:hypothetical protein ACV344_32015 [Pseudomonas aeruginosa]|uniref:hypothetical protein n=1 Tax=Pseudomonas aeruginosa TaxID=287 RepID=UPI00117B0EF2|nr:hypothetical protein [Pseudomonas aeruginosa]TRO97399.1 hypothetical protein FNL66_33495 [Pseudomonas aeruginosa]HCD5837172.1 hypothetical protein [Pseudomonas aeruginosa]HCD6471437.1 hypothetical protein [Pseudomonas aeruginosa]
MSEVERFNEYTWGVTEDEHGEYVRYADYYALAAEAQALREEVAALRARVMVTPDASTVYAALDARERLFTSPENIRVALEAQSRLNGKTVSEGLLRLTLEFIMATNYKGSIPLGLIEELRALLNQDKENGNG